MRGRGFLRAKKTRDPFGPGYAPFGPVEAHQFEDFTDDLVIWVVFIDLLGGTLPTTAAPQHGTDDLIDGSSRVKKTLKWVN